MNPIISVIVPIYNCERFLNECLNSITNQTIKNIEIICVNDGTKDNSIDIVKDFISKDNRVLLINQTNKGLGAARNAGIKIAKGKYIGFVDSDDFIKNTMFKSMCAVAERDNSDVVISNPYIYNNNDCNIYPYRRMFDFYRLSKLGAFNSKDHPEVLEFIGCWDKIYRRDFLLKYNLLNPENRIYEDFLFTYKTLVLANKISFVKDSYYYYRKFSGSSITDLEKDNYSFKLDFLKNLQEGKKFLIDSGTYKIFEKAFLQYCLTFGSFHFYNIKKRRYQKKFAVQLKLIVGKNSDSVINELINERLVREDFVKTIRKTKI